MPGFRGKRRALERAVASLPNWIHTIEVGDGVWTPGHWPKESQRHVREALDAIDFDGRKVLDIGTLDGLWAFEAEQRGASQVYATDMASQVSSDRRPGSFASRTSFAGFRAHYHPDLSVYDVGRLGLDDFDVVLFIGVTTTCAIHCSRCLGCDRL